jgi:hypothetical protein
MIISFVVLVWFRLVASAAAARVVVPPLGVCTALVAIA